MSPTSLRTLTNACIGMSFAPTVLLFSGTTVLIIQLARKTKFIVIQIYNYLADRESRQIKVTLKDPWPE